MAESRYHMETADGTRIVEMPNTQMGKNFLIGLRKGRPDLFFRQRIKSVLQMRPSDIKVGVLVSKVYSWCW
jgi:hypothetical protein